MVETFKKEEFIVLFETELVAEKTYKNSNISQHIVFWLCFTVCNERSSKSSDNVSWLFENRKAHANGFSETVIDDLAGTAIEIKVKS